MIFWRNFPVCFPLWLFSESNVKKKSNFQFWFPSFLGYVAMSEKLKKMNSVEGPLRKLRFCKWASPKMQQIIKQVGPSRQLFETVNFAFMNFFDFLVKTALFGAFLIFLVDLCHKLRPKIKRGNYIISSTELDFRP